MKKGVFIIAIALAFLSISFIFAQQQRSGDIGDLIKSGIEMVVDAIAPFASYLFGDISGSKDFSSGSLLFAKVLFFIILLSVIWLSLEKVDFFSDFPWAHWLISIIVSILAVRYLSDQSWMLAILFPYGTLGIAILAGLPFVIYFFVVNVGMKNSIPLMRRIAWIFFAVIFIGLWLTRDTGQGIWLYPITALAAIVMASIDGSIQRFFRKMKLERIGKRSIEEAETEILARLHKLDEAKKYMDHAEYKRRKQKLQRELRSL
jgi:diacylglycerol kinase